MPFIKNPAFDQLISKFVKGKQTQTLFLLAAFFIVTAGLAQIPENDKLAKHPLYLFQSGVFYRIADRFPENRDSDTTTTKCFGIDCTNFYYINKPVSKTRQIKRLVITEMDGDSSLDLPDDVYSQIQELKLYSRDYGQFLPIDINRFVNLRALVVDYGQGENCGGFVRPSVEFAWRPGQLTNLTKLQYINALGTWINPLELQAKKISQLRIETDMFSPYPIAKILPSEDYSILYKNSYYQQLLYAMTLYISAPYAYSKFGMFTKVDSVSLGNKRWKYHYIAGGNIVLVEAFENNGKADSVWTFYLKDGKTIDARATFHNDSVVQFFGSYGVGTNHLFVSQQYSPDSFLVHKKLYYQDSTVTKAIYHFNNWHTVIVSEQRYGHPLFGKFKVYQSGQAVRILDLSDPFLRPYDRYLSIPQSQSVH